MMMRPVGTSTYEMAQDPAKYDLEKIYTAAEMVGLQNRKKLHPTLPIQTAPSVFGP
jgi:hypothetical protein